MNINYIQSFLMLAQYHSYQRASQELFITQPTLTSRIQVLERDLGRPLFVRNKAGVTLTQYGELFHPYAERIVEAYALSRLELGNEKQEIMIGTIMSASVTFLPKVIAQFKKEKPHVSIKVYAGYSIHILEKILREECDFAITQQLSHPQIVSVPIVQDPVSLFVPRGHKFAGRTVTLEEVCKEPLICYDPNSEPWQKYLAAFAQQQLTPNIVFNITSIEACKTMVINGMGIAFMPELSMDADPKMSAICKVPIAPFLDISRTITVIYLADRKPPPYLSFFFDILDSLGVYSRPSRG